MEKHTTKYVLFFNVCLVTFEIDAHVMSFRPSRNPLVLALWTASGGAPADSTNLIPGIMLPLR